MVDGLRGVQRVAEAGRQIGYAASRGWQRGYAVEAGGGGWITGCVEGGEGVTWRRQAAADGLCDT